MPFTLHSVFSQPGCTRTVYSQIPLSRSVFQTPGRVRCQDGRHRASPPQAAERVPTKSASPVHSLTRKGLALLAAGSIWLSGPGNAMAIDKISEFGASGLFLKDTVETLSLEDPDVKGITVYITDFKRSLADKLAKDFFSEPSQASVTCAITGAISVADERQLRGSEGKEIFSEGRSGLQLFKNKTVRVRRVFDEKHKTLLYIAYSTRLGSGNDQQVSAGRYKTSICALPLSPEVNRATAVDQSSVPSSLTGAK
ncbi:hypothetical protein WJX74_004679 [Apatococcus lobatus]|uniref:CreA protein n=1 Tax=Apatococcus lobatus TaxID=904363 RepID=A0AAW1SBD7_9CHLO